LRRIVEMYGTVARIRVLTDQLDAFKEFVNVYADDGSPGFLGSYIYQMDKDANEFYLVAVFESRESYAANADDPGTHERFMQLRAFLESDPEWHDGEIIGHFAR
jgi:quinol monooxygenase YgiN